MPRSDRGGSPSRCCHAGRGDRAARSDASPSTRSPSRRPRRARDRRVPRARPTARAGRRRRAAPRRPAARATRTAPTAAHVAPRHRLGERPGVQIERRARRRSSARQLSVELRPPRPGSRSVERPVAVVHARGDELGRRRRVREQRRRGRADHAVGDREQRLVRSPGIGIEPSTTSDQPACATTRGTSARRSS